LDTTPLPLPFPDRAEPADFAEEPVREPVAVFADAEPRELAFVPDDVFELAARACFAFVGSACAEAVRRVPPEFTFFEPADLSFAALLAESVFALVVLDGLLVAFALISVFEPDRALELPLVVAML
jgi:hypothetical protein